MLQTERLSIRPVVPEDWEELRDIWVSFNASPYARFDKPHATDDASVRDRVARWAAANGGTEHMFFAVCLGQRVIGYAAFNLREDGYELGYCFHSAYHGRGFGKESLTALLEHLRKLGITRVLAGTALENQPSVGLLRSLGFRQTGTETVSFYKDAEGRPIQFEGGIFVLD